MDPYREPQDEEIPCSLWGSVSVRGSKLKCLQLAGASGLKQAQCVNRRPSWIVFSSQFGKRCRYRYVSLLLENYLGDKR